MMVIGISKVVSHKEAGSKRWTTIP